VFPVLAISTAALAPITYYSFLKGVVPAASGPTNVTGLSAWTAGTPYRVDVTNAPNLPGASAHLGQIANNQAVDSAAGFVLASGIGTASFSVAPGYADAYQGEVQFIDYPPGLTRTVSFAKRFAGGGATQALDLTPGVLPQLATLTVTGTTRAVVTWTSTGSLAATDGGAVSVTWSKPVDGGFDAGMWTFIVPPDALTLTLPELPAALAAIGPDASSSALTPSAAFVESDLLAGYDAARTQAGAFGLVDVLMGLSLNGLKSPALPAAGTLRITAITPGG
jgi:hypothetical protein